MKKVQSKKSAQPLDGQLVFVRHAESAWNKLGIWTGSTDVHLSPKGREDAVKMGRALRDLSFHYVYVSSQIRSIETLLHMMESAAYLKKLEYERTPLLNERDYGDYTGLNKWEVLEKLGDEIFIKIRRGWDHPIPNGESMKMVHARTVPFYTEHILPKLGAGKNVLVVTSGNTIRSLIKHLEEIEDEAIADVEMPFDHLLIYRVNQAGLSHQKQVRKVDIVLPHA